MSDTKISDENKLLLEYLANATEPEDYQLCQNLPTTELIEKVIEKANTMEVENTLLYYGYSLNIPFDNFEAFSKDVADKLATMGSEETLSEEEIIDIAREHLI